MSKDSNSKGTQEEQIEVIKRRSLTLNLMRNPNSMADLGFDMSSFAQEFGDQDERFQEARKAVLSTEKVKNAILDMVISLGNISYTDPGNPAPAKVAREVLRTFYPEIPADMPIAEVIARAGAEKKIPVENAEAAFAEIEQMTRKRSLLTKARALTSKERGVSELAVYDIQNIGRTLGDTAKHFGEDDIRFKTAREAILRSDKILSVILHDVCALAVEKDAESQENGRNIFCALYPDTPKEAHIFDIVNLAARKVNEIQNKTDINLH